MEKNKNSRPTSHGHIWKIMISTPLLFPIKHIPWCNWHMPCTNFPHPAGYTSPPKATRVPVLRISSASCISSHCHPALLYQKLMIRNRHRKSLLTNESHVRGWYLPMSSFFPLHHLCRWFSEFCFVFLSVFERNRGLSSKAANGSPTYFACPTVYYKVE